MTSDSAAINVRMNEPIKVGPLGRCELRALEAAHGEADATVAAAVRDILHDRGTEWPPRMVPALVREGGAVFLAFSPKEAT